MRRWRRGDVVVLREMWDGRVFSARPLIVVEDRQDMRVFYAPARNRYRIPVDSNGIELRLPGGDWRLREVEGTQRRVLSFSFPGVPYAVLLLWDDETDRFLEYYVNMEDPLRPTDLGFDTTDNILDALIEPDRSAWHWKDEDELREAIARGLFTEHQAAHVRRAGERGIEHVLLREPPFDRDWEDWRPDPAWGRPLLPVGWDSLT
jgi:uncharacterized protein DUF402